MIDRSGFGAATAEFSFGLGDGGPDDRVSLEALAITFPQRKKQWHENVNLTLPEGAKARMDAVLEDGEDRLDLIRAAIDREVGRRERALKRQDSDAPSTKLGAEMRKDGRGHGDHDRDPGTTWVGAAAFALAALSAGWLLAGRLGFMW